MLLNTNLYTLWWFVYKNCINLLFCISTYLKWNWHGIVNSTRNFHQCYQMLPISPIVTSIPIQFYFEKINSNSIPPSGSQFKFPIQFYFEKINSNSIPPSGSQFKFKFRSTQTLVSIPDYIVHCSVSANYMVFALSCIFGFGQNFTEHATWDAVWLQAE